MKELPTPPLAAMPNAVEVLRVWVAEGSPQQFILQPTWDDPGAWGILLADLARHVAKAYATDGLSETEAFERVVTGLLAELENPTER